MKQLQTLAAVGALLVCGVFVHAQQDPPRGEISSTPSPSLQPSSWLRGSVSVQGKDHVLQELLPRLQAYWTGRNGYDLAAFRHLVTPTFSFYSEMTGGQPSVGAEALTAVSDYPDRPDESFHITGRTLTLHKFFTKPGKAVMYLDETVSWLNTGPAARRQYGDLPVEVTWSWKQTWVKQHDEWRLAAVVNRK